MSSVAGVPKRLTRSPRRDRAARDYTKWPFDSIGSEEPAVGSTRADGDPHRSGTFWAIPFVGSFGPIDVNPCVDVTTGEFYADVPPLGLARLARALRMRIARHVENSIRHFTDSTHNTYFTPIVSRRIACRPAVLLKVPENRPSLEDRIVRPGDFSPATR